MPVLDAMIIGAAKSGTSSLLRYLGQHPEVWTQPIEEATCFWEPDETAFQRQLRDMMTGSRGDAVRLGKLAGCMYGDEALRRLREASPDCRLLILLRDPRERAYSAWRYAVRRGYDTHASFDAALDFELSPEFQRLDAGQQRMRAYLARGEYSTHLRRVHNYFGPAQLHVSLLEDLQAAPGRELRAMFEHLGCSDAPPVDSSQVHNVAAVARFPRAAALLNSRSPWKQGLARRLPYVWRQRVRERFLRLNERRPETEPMDDGTRQRLTTHFAPFNRDLAALTGLDLSKWDEPQ